MRLTTIPPSWATALREDAVAPSGGYTARQRLRIERRFVGPHVVTIRVGEAPKRDYKHMNVGDRRRHFEARARWVKRSPYCRACTEPIRHGEKAVAFTLYRDDGALWSRTAYIHRDACEGGE